MGKLRSPFWYACFTDALGRRLKKSTGLTAKSKAMEMARTWEKASAEARQLRLTEARAREVISELMQSVGGDSLTVFTVEQWLADFVKGKRKSRSEKTAERHEQVKGEFMEFLGHRAKLNIAAITSRDIASFRDHRQSLGLAPATVNLDVAILSSAFNAALRQGHVSVNPCLAVEPLKNKPKRKGVFSPEQVTALLKAAKGDWRGLIMVAFYSGQRLQDCATLRWRNIDLVSDIKTIRFQTRKTDAEVVTVIHPALEDHLLSLPTAKSDDEYLFPDAGGAQGELAQFQFQRVDGPSAYRPRHNPRAQPIGPQRVLIEFPQSASQLLVDPSQRWRVRRAADDHRRPFIAGHASEVYASRVGADARCHRGVANALAG